MEESYSRSICRRRLAYILSGGALFVIFLADRSAGLFGGKSAAGGHPRQKPGSGGPNGPLWLPGEERERDYEYDGLMDKVRGTGHNKGGRKQQQTVQKKGWRDTHARHHAQQQQGQKKQPQPLGPRHKGAVGGDKKKNHLDAAGGAGRGSVNSVKRTRHNPRGHSSDDVDASSDDRDRAALPVYDYTRSDEVPASSDASAVARSAAAPAFESLECRSSVVDFVINATDVRDECEGLRKAFDKTCSAHAMQQHQQGAAASNAGTSGAVASGGAGAMQRRRRALAAYGARYSDDDERDGVRTDYVADVAIVDGYRGESFAERTARSARVMWRYVRSRAWHGEEEDALLFADDELIGDSWDEAVYQVRHEYDRSPEYRDKAERMLGSEIRRRLSEERRSVEYNPPSPARDLFEAGLVSFNSTWWARRRQRRLARAGGLSRGGKDADPDDEEEEKVEYAPVTTKKKKRGMPGPENFVDISEDTRKVDEPAEEGTVAQEQPQPRDSADPVAPGAGIGHMMLSPKLPTASEHVDGQMLNDAVLLAEGGTNEEIASAVLSKTNGTSASANATKSSDAAVVDAERSSKAVSDATAAVSAVLNDPDSVEARTCCASILNVFHEHCDHPEEDDLSDRRLFLIVFVIAFCGMVKSLIRHFRIRWLPEAAGCILVGVLAWVILLFVPHFEIGFDGDMFLRVLVPPIVFEAALSIDKKSFQRHAIPIVLFAVVGTLVSTILTAFIVHEGSYVLQGLGLIHLHIPFVESLLFGALISSIDPIAVLSVLSNMGMTDTDTIYVLIFGESLLNDGVAIVLFETLVHFLDESLLIDGAAVGAAAVHFLVVALGSLMVGIVSGMCCTAYYYAMRGVQTPLVEVCMFLCWAFIPYYICDGVGWSGIVSVVAVGIVMDMYVVGQKSDGEADSETDHNDELDSFLNGGSTATGSSIHSQGGSTWSRVFSQEGHLSEKSKSHIHFVAQTNATLMETAIFAYLGLFLFSSRYHWNFLLAVLGILACLCSRGAMIPLFSRLSNLLSRLILNRPGCYSSKLSRSQHDETDPSVAREEPLNHLIIDNRMQAVLWFAGLRGAMSFALVENIPLYDTVTKQGSRLKPELKAMTSACIVFTVFVLGGSTYYLMEWLGLSPGGGGGGKAEQDMIEMGAPLVRKQSDMSGRAPPPRRKRGSPPSTRRNGGALNGHRSANGETKAAMRHRVAGGPSPQKKSGSVFS